MTTCAQRPGAGLRRFDSNTATALALAEQFTGLEPDVLPAHVLSAFKRAAVYLGYPARLVQTIDLLFSWTLAQDWRGGQIPVVWPGNAKLAQLLGITVRQVQKLLNQAQALGLIAFRDSPNGHRGGQRDKHGKLLWAYGVMLSPLGVRYREFLEVSARGAAEDKRIDDLGRRLSAARRGIRALSQTVIDLSLPCFRPDEEIALARMATDQVRGSRDIAMIEIVVKQLEDRRRLLERSVQDTIVVTTPPNLSKSSCSHDPQDTHSTTTSQLPSATADYSNGLAGLGSGAYDVRTNEPQTQVEADLDKHGVDASFVREIAPELLGQLDYGPLTWGNVVALAERLAGQHRIPVSAWRDACRIMGQKGAAAAVIATIEKHRGGEVLQPGAYLRGMAKKARIGDLNLGKTMYGLKDHQRVTGMRSLASGDAGSIGALANRLLHRTAESRNLGFDRR